MKDLEYEEEYLTVEEVCKILKIGKTLGYLLVNQKDFPKTKFGRCIRIPKSEFSRYLKHNLYKDVDLA